MSHNVLCIDLDGPVINCSERYYEVYQNNVSRLGGTPISRDMFWEHKRDRMNEKYLLEQSCVEVIHHDQYRKSKISLIEDEQYLDMDSLQPDVERILTLIKNNFQKVILITLRRNRITLEKQLAKLDLVRYFDHILSGFDEGVPAWKIKVDLYLNKMSAEYISGCTGFFIGDTETDILAGREIGLKTVGVLSGIRSRKILEKYNPDCIIDSLSNFETVMQLA